MKRIFILASLLFLFLPKIALSTGSWTQQAAGDWGAGSGVNVDTTSIPGNVQISVSLLNSTTFNLLINSSSQWGAGTGVNVDTTSAPNKLQLKLLNNLTQNTGAQWNSGTNNQTVVSGNSVILNTETYNYNVTNTNYANTSITQTGGMTFVSGQSPPFDESWDYDLGSAISSLSGFQVNSITGTPLAGGTKE